MNEVTNTDTGTPGTDAPQGDAVAANAPVAPETPAEIRKFKVKVQDQEREVTEDELVRNYQLREASNAKFEEANAMRQQAAQLAKILQDGDPRELFRKLGKDPRALAEQWLAEALEEEMLDPKDKEVRQLKRQLADKEATEKAARDQQERAQHEQLKQHYQANLQKDILEVLDTAGLPKSSRTVARIAYYMQQGLHNDVELSPRDVVDLVRQDYIQEIQDLTGNLDGDKLLALLGKDVPEKLRKHELAKLKDNPRKQGGTPAKQPDPKQRPNTKRRFRNTDINSVFKDLRKS